MADPQKQAADLLKNPQFLAMFQKAMGEEGIPKEGEPGREAWLKKMQENLKAESEVEAKKQMEEVQTEEDGSKWCYIQATPGFCIKCHSPQGKVFINVCQHDKIAEPMPLEGEDAEDAEIKFRIPLSCGAARPDRDKAGRPCKVYDVIVNPNTIKRCAEENEFRRFVAALCMTWIKQKSEPNMNAEEFTNLNFKCKGQIDIQRVRLSAPGKGDGNALNDEIKLPDQGRAQGSQPNTRTPGRKMVSELGDENSNKASTANDNKTTKASSPKKNVPRPTFEVKQEGLYNWGTHSKPAKNPYFRTNPPAKYVVEVFLPGTTSIKEVDVQLRQRAIVLTYVDEEDEGPFLMIPLQLPVAEDPLSAKFTKKKSQLVLELAVELPDETAAPKTAASRDACEIEAEEEAKEKLRRDAEYEARRQKLERMQKEEEAIMEQRKELVAGMNAIQEGLVPPALADEIKKMPPEQKRTMMQRIESRTKTGDQVDQLIERLPDDALNAISDLIRSELGLQPLHNKPKQQEKKPKEEVEADKKKDLGVPPPEDPVSSSAAVPTGDSNVTEYNFAKKAENLFGVKMYNRYVFALDH